MGFSIHDNTDLANNVILSRKSNPYIPAQIIYAIEHACLGYLPYNYASISNNQY